MTFIDDLVPVYYELTRIGIQRKNGDAVAIADMRILNADGRQLITHNPQTTLTTQEKQALVAFVNRELAAFETVTGLTEWVEP